MLMTFSWLLYTNEFFSSLAFVLADAQAMMHMFILSLTSATGMCLCSVCVSAAFMICGVGYGWYVVCICMGTSDMTCLHFVESLH